jgi:hypothetical protein
MHWLETVSPVRVPLKVDEHYNGRFPNGSSLAKLNGRTYLIFTRPVTDKRDEVIGRIIVPKDITVEEGAVRNQAIFSVCLTILAWIVAVAIVIGYYVQDEMRQRLRAITLEEALKRGECQVIEFKEGVAADLLPRTMAAFANSEGGCIFLVVTDELRVVGLQETTPEAHDKLQKAIRAMAEKISPRLLPEVSFLEYAGMTVARVFVPRGSEPLYMVDGTVWIRRLSAVDKAKPEEVRDRRTSPIAEFHTDE